MPEVWRRLLVAHKPDRLGRCSGCRTSSGSGARWPGSLHAIASEAQRRNGRRLGQAVGGGERAGAATAEDGEVFEAAVAGEGVDLAVEGGEGLGGVGGPALGLEEGDVGVAADEVDVPVAA